MVLLKSLSHNNSSSISLPETIVNFNHKYDKDDEIGFIYINIEMCLLWQYHANICNDCKSFFNHIMSPMKDDWIFEYKNEIYLILPNNTGKNYLDNINSLTISKDFTGSRIELKVKRLKTEDIKEFEKEEKYEICNYLLKNSNN